MVWIVNGWTSSKCLIEWLLSQGSFHCGLPNRSTCEWWTLRATKPKSFWAEAVFSKLWHIVELLSAAWIHRGAGDLTTLQQPSTLGKCLLYEMVKSQCWYRYWVIIQVLNRPKHIWNMDTIPEWSRVFGTMCSLATVMPSWLNRSDTGSKLLLPPSAQMSLLTSLTVQTGHVLRPQLLNPSVQLYGHRMRMSIWCLRQCPWILTNNQCLFFYCHWGIWWRTLLLY